MIGAEAKLSTDRGPQAGPIENLALNLRSCHRFGAHGLDRQFILIAGVEMSDGADEHAASHQELLFRPREASAVP